PALDLGPGGEQQLVGDPAIEEIVAGHEVLVRILLSVLGEVRVAPAALLGLAETTRVLDNTIEGDQSRHAELPHSELLTCATRICCQRRARHRPGSRPPAPRRAGDGHASKLAQVWHQPDADAGKEARQETGKIPARPPRGPSSPPCPQDLRLLTGELPGRYSADRSPGPRRCTAPSRDFHGFGSRPSPAAGLLR